MSNVKKEPLSRQHWLWVRNQLGLKGLSLASISKAHGYHKSAAGLVRDYRYPFFEKVIAKILDLTPQDLFPSRYAVDGKPIGRNYTLTKMGLKSMEKRRNCNEKKD